MRRGAVKRSVVLYGGGRQSSGSDPMAAAQEVDYNGQEAAQQVVEGIAVGEEVEYFTSAPQPQIRPYLDIREEASREMIRPYDPPVNLEP